MTSKKKKKRKGPLQELVLAADHGILAELAHSTDSGRLIHGKPAT
ncbi:MAG: hypothetical protein SWH78_17600 [Thermodesulfobacteriota bacterium]|nr:hypothetical protein [Thermodesulfobacteriota bacterium]